MVRKAESDLGLFLCLLPPILYVSVVQWITKFAVLSLAIHLRGVFVSVHSKVFVILNSLFIIEVHQPRRGEVIYVSQSSLGK